MFDVLVVGGGITGAGVALDAASRGLSVALVERDDFAAGTSSRSSKLVHGGLRYLQQREFRLVYEALAERQILMHTAPHLVSVLPFLIPVTRGGGGVVGRRMGRLVGLALWQYDLTGGWRIGHRHRRLNSLEARAMAPTLPQNRLSSGYLYHDAHVDDARLTLAVLRTAAERFGAAIVNRCAVESIVHDDAGRVRGVRAAVGAEPAVAPGVGTSPPGLPIEIRARIVVNATGVWADTVQGLDGRRHSPNLRPAKGIHITVAHSRIGNEVALVIPGPGDGRTIFVIPWGEHTYVGTTDTDHPAGLEDPVAEPVDIDYLVAAVNGALDLTATGGPLGRHDVLGVWAGLRPLVGSEAGVSAKTADLSRRHRVTVADDGLITIAGGKLTTYRQMASDTVDAVVARLAAAGSARARRRSVRQNPSRTKDVVVVGGEDVARWDPPSSAADAHLRGRYGSERPVILAMCEADPSLSAPLVPGLAYLRSEALFAVRHEMATTLDDVLSRRTRARILDARAACEAASDVACLIAPDLGWTDAQAHAQADAFCRSVHDELTAAGLAAAVPAP